MAVQTLDHRTSKDTVAASNLDRLVDDRAGDSGWPDRFGGATVWSETDPRGIMRILFIVIAAAAFAGFMPASPVQAQLAIAFDTVTGKAVAFAGTTDAARNQREALSGCNSRSCQIVATGKKTCAAIAETLTTGGSIWAVGYGTTTSVAEQAAWFNCRNKGGVNCKTAAAICD
ncbi:MAG: DUF4189 domain-containing protein [Reyranellaceae bacterium]